MLLVLEELNLGTSGLISESTRLEIGRIIGARSMVFGSYIVINNIMRMDLRKVEVETGLVLKAISKIKLPSLEWYHINSIQAILPLLAVRYMLTAFSSQTQKILQKALEPSVLSRNSLTQKVKIWKTNIKKHH